MQRIIDERRLAFFLFPNMKFHCLLTGIIMLMGVLIGAVPTQAQGCAYWVAPPPDGDDSHPGTFAKPWATRIVPYGSKMAYMLV